MLFKTKLLEQGLLNWKALGYNAMTPNVSRFHQIC